MKNLFITTFLLVCFIVKAEERVVENPSFSVSSHSNVIIDKVELKNAETVLYMTIYGGRGWSRIASDTYIRVNGEKYIVKSSNGIELDKETYPDSTGRLVFTLHFPAIDSATQQLDFIESDCSDCFKIWGVELQPGISAKRASVPESIKNQEVVEDDGKSLEMPQLKYGEAVFKGQFLGYVPEMKWNIELYINNPVTGVQEELETPVKEDGSFELKVPLVTTMQVLFRTPIYNNYVLLSPDKETTVYVDLYQRSCQETKSKALKCPEERYMYFAGANAEINNQMEDKRIRKITSDFMNQTRDSKAIINMSAEQYKSYILEKMNQAIDKLLPIGLTKKAYEFAVMDIQSDAIHALMFAESALYSAFRKEHKLKYEDEMTGYTQPVIDKAFYSFLKEIPFDNQLSLYNGSFSNNINSCKYIEKQEIRINIQAKAMYQEIIDLGNLSSEEKKYAEYLQSTTSDSWSIEKQQDFRGKTVETMQRLIETGKLDDKTGKLVNELIPLCNDSKIDINTVREKVGVILILLVRNGIFSQEETQNFFESIEPERIDSAKESEFSEEVKKSFILKSNEIRRQFFEKQRREQAKSYLADILGTSQGIVFDLMTTQSLCGKFEEFVPLTAEELKEIQQMENSFYFNYLTQKNNELLAQIEINKNKKGYNVHDVPETDEEKLFAEILKPFAGKVILVDFWATWCGPCRDAMKRFEPTKERLKEKGVVFVYLTDESSPLGAWQNMIPTIPGEHFRLKNDQFSYLKKKFGARGIPSYLILNKAGEQIYFRVGFEGAAKLEKLITEAL